ncbi:TonB-dependent receptor domain-containing protein [Ochrobactrum quorumnocens]|jgi:vitamin B12 transporter|uniref:Heme transporter BhuA n=1 Tax=Ochrobactrum quorumnocens TaxID=271865 RepID=A0A248UKQ7_9HYPH|nr:TonB-dependent receptor [[Ochrobactrum] quorumnocens]ASV87437.1 tonB dependent receptor family protein [[Ochrobactrum] quorumnocens]KAA9367604.1 TonB-dependent receptor [[Ochrobactrum] quorumnocens]MBD7989905.1 TonB-dependent receptor [Ochrobactrum gallinarum]
MHILQLSAYLASTILVAVPLDAIAQTNLNAQDGVVLDMIVVTPLRRATSLQRSTSSVTVIDKAEIERSASPDLQSLLQYYPGISITANGGQGSSSNLYIRGMSSKQTVVLVNGVRTASATTGATALSNIPLSSIDRIEIAKGAHSSQYGADAMGGVINIITKQGGACGERSFCGSVTTGVTHPWGGYVSGSLQGRSKDGIDYAFGAAVTGTQGYNFTTPEAFGYEPDRDGFLQGSFNFALSKDFDWGKIYADGLLSRGRNQYDAKAPSANEAYTTAFSGKLGARVDHSSDWSSTIEFSSGLDHSRNFRKGVSGSDRFETKRYGVFASTEKQFDTGNVSHVVTGGVEAYREEVDATTAYAETSRNLAAVFGQYSLEYDALRFDGGVRYDYNEQFGDVVTYNLGGSYEILPDLVLRSSFGTGFRAPTFNELYYPGFANADLQPEKSRSYEIGLNWQASANTSLDMAFYQTWLRDAILSTAPSYLPYNIARAQVTGFDATLTHRFNDSWGFKGSIDLKRPLDEDTDNDLAYRERVKATAEVNFKPIEKLDLTARMRYGGSRYTSAANTNKLDPYVTADFIALYEIDKQSQLKLSVENIFDKDYQTTSGYNAPGRSFNVGLTRNF